MCVPALLARAGHRRCMQATADVICGHAMPPCPALPYRAMAPCLARPVPPSIPPCPVLLLLQIAPKVLTWSQLAAAGYNAAQRAWYGKEAVPQWKPSFADCVDHFALHPGALAMLKGFMKGMKLPVDKVIPSYAVLRDYGNMSASTTWC
jgi:hypothetical protein